MNEDDEIINADDDDEKELDQDNDNSEEDNDKETSEDLKGGEIESEDTEVIDDEESFLNDSTDENDTEDDTVETEENEEEDDKEELELIDPMFDESFKQVSAEVLEVELTDGIEIETEV